MGIRIEAYAVDIPRLDAFLNSSLTDLIIRYHRDGIDERTQLTFTIGNAPDHYQITPRGRMRACIGELPNRTDESLTEDQVRLTDTLQRTAREHISGDNIYQAKSLFRAFSNCKGIDFIKRLTGGGRRWWVGSVLETAQDLLSGEEYEELEQLFCKILRGVDCDFDIAPDDPGFVTKGLPFVPDIDPDMRFGRWSDIECSSAVSLLSKIMASSPTFKCPSQIRDGDTNDSEWHEWARGNVSSFLQMRDLDYRVCNMLSFIG